MKIKYLGHATLLVELNDKKLLFDPFITGNPLAGDIDMGQLEPDYILITHGHEDHVLDVEMIAKNSSSTLISNYEIITWYGKRGLSGHPLNHGGKCQFDFGMVKYVNAVHSSMMPDGSYGGNPGGFVIWTEDVCLYVAGDTALTEDMKLIPKTCPKLDVAVLPVGDNFTMGYEDALLACDYIECDKVIGCHFDTFPPIQIDRDKAIKHFSDAGKELILPDIGQVIDV